MTRPPSEKQKKLYGFLKKQRGKPFHLQPLVQATGYGEASAERSLGEHWGKVVERWGSSTPKRWRTTTVFDGMSLEEFHRAISQSKRDQTLGRLRNARARELVALARTQAHVALELLNRPALSSRVECFLVLFLNAWELLLKAEVVERDGWDAVFESKPRKAGKPPRSRRFEAIVSDLPSNTDAEAALKTQLSDLYGLRNQAAHLLLCSPSREMLHLFAGSVRSLSTRFEAFTGSRLFAAADVAGYLVLVGITDLSGEIQSAQVSSDLDQHIRANISKYGEAYAIPLRVRLHAVDDDLAASAQLGEGHVLTSSTKAIRETYRYKRDEVARRATRALADQGHAIEVREHHVDLVRRKESWGTTSENPFVTEFPAAKLYSQAACGRIVDLLNERPNYLEVAQQQEQKRQSKRRKRKQSEDPGSIRRKP